MTPAPRPRPLSWLAAGAALLLLAGCGAAEPTLDERVEDIDAAVEVYRTVDGAECDEPGVPNRNGSTTMVLCEDGATIAWTDEERDEDVRELLAAMLSDDGIDAVVGANVTIMDVDTAEVSEQIGGFHL